MRAVQTATAGLPSGAARFEWFTAAPEVAPVTGAVDAPACDEFDIELRRTGGLLHVPPGKSVLEVLEHHGVEVPFSCREGLCGTCETGVCAGEPDHRDYVLTQEQQQAGQSMMVCVSRSRSSVLVLDL